MSTPKEVIDKVVFGGLYKVKSGTWQTGYNDQCYCLAVPVMDDKGYLWMQDTYQIDSPWYSKEKNGVDNKTDAAILQICSFGEGYNGWCVKKARANYYYKNQMQIMSEYDLSHFELICDLHDYHWIGHEDYRDYKPEDVIHDCPLYFEHGYSWNLGRAKGGILVRNGAKKDSARMLEAEIQDVYSWFHYPRGERTTQRLDIAVQRCIEDGTMTEELIEKVRVVKALNDRLNEMSKEFAEFKKSIK